MYHVQNSLDTQKTKMRGKKIEAKGEEQCLSHIYPDKTNDIQFNQLSWPCKSGIIGGWVAIILYILAFIAGMIGGMIE